MITTIELLEALKQEADLPSDYAVAKYLQVSQQAVSKWRNGRTMSEEICLKVAKELDLDEDLVLLSNLCEKQVDDKAKNALKRLMAS